MNSRVKLRLHEMAGVVTKVRTHQVGRYALAKMQASLDGEYEIRAEGEFRG